MKNNNEDLERKLKKLRDLAQKVDERKNEQEVQNLIYSFESKIRDLEGRLSTYGRTVQEKEISEKTAKKEKKEMQREISRLTKEINSYQRQISNYKSLESEYRAQQRRIDELSKDLEAERKISAIRKPTATQDYQLFVHNFRENNSTSRDNKTPIKEKPKKTGGQEYFSYVVYKCKIGAIISFGMTIAAPFVKHDKLREALLIAGMGTLIIGIPFSLLIGYMRSKYM